MLCVFCAGKIVPERTKFYYEPYTFIYNNNSEKDKYTIRSMQSML